MKRRKLLTKVTQSAPVRESFCIFNKCVILPPFTKADNSIVVHVDVAEEAVQPAVGYGKACSRKRRAQLVLIEIATVITVYVLE